MTLTTPAEHPFATYVRILGKGQRGSRGLTREEAEHAMGMVMRGEVTDEQLGAFLMLLRFKEESPEELAGFCSAVRAAINAPEIAVDLDWPSYAGKKRQLNWYLLAAKCLAKQGHRVFLHGGGAHTAGRLYSEALLADLDIPLCHDWQSVAQALEQHNIAFMPLAAWSPRLQHMIDLRNILGLRSPIHSLVRLINPLQARCGLQSIFHPGYQAVHQEASRLLGDHALVVKGDGGEVEMRPDVDSEVLGTQAGTSWTERWSALSNQRLMKPEQLDPAQLRSVWTKTTSNAYGELAAQATMALALRGLGLEQDEAQQRAQQYWQAR